MSETREEFEAGGSKWVLLDGRDTPVVGWVIDREDGRVCVRDGYERTGGGEVRVEIEDDITRTHVAHLPAPVLARALRLMGYRVEEPKKDEEPRSFKLTGKYQDAEVTNVNDGTPLVALCVGALGNDYTSYFTPDEAATLGEILARAALVKASP